MAHGRTGHAPLPLSVGECFAEIQALNDRKVNPGGRRHSGDGLLRAPNEPADELADTVKPAWR